MKWIDRLKNTKASCAHAREPSKPPKGGNEVGFLGLLAYPHGGLQNFNEADAPPPDLTPAAGVSEPAPDVLLSVEPTPDTPPPPPIPWHHLSADWRKAFTAWNDHRATCPTCSASERTAATAGTGIRCKLGQRLHTAYESALDSSPT